MGCRAVSGRSRRSGDRERGCGAGSDSAVSGGVPLHRHSDPHSLAGAALLTVPIGSGEAVTAVEPVGEARVFKHHQEHKAYQDYQAKLAAWQQQRDAYADLVNVAATYAGEPSPDIMLKPGETVFAAVTHVALVEDRRGAGEWKGRSQ